VADRRLPARKRDWLRLFADLDIQPSKGRGQNFLLDPDVITDILKAAKVCRDDVVVEIGPGGGILTDALVQRAGRVTAIEIDPVLAAHIRSAFAGVPGFALVEGDALAVSYDELMRGQPFKIAANLPYSVGTAIIQRFLETSSTLTSATVMVQREVGERMLAEPPQMSILSVAVQLMATPRADFIVPPESFWPSPKIESMVLTLIPRPEPLLPSTERPDFFRLVNAGFRHKRKNIANSLQDESRLPKALINEALTTVGIDPVRRAQTLALEEWLALLPAWQAVLLSHTA